MTESRSVPKVVMSSGEDGLIGIPFPEHSSELLSRLNDQRRAGLLCDLTLTSRGARYPTHRSVMAAVSLYFRRLFGVDEEGGGGGGASAFSVCQLDCVSPDALDALLDFAYTATLTIRASNMRDVLRAAQLLGIQCVENACRDILGEEEETRGGHEEERRGGDEEERRGGDEEKEEGGRRSPRRSPDHHHQGASYDKLGTAAATAAEGREPPTPPPRERGSRRKTDRTKMRRVASVTGGVEQDPAAAPQTTVIAPQTTVLDSSALQQQEGEEEEEVEGEGSKPVTASGLGLGGGQRRRQGEEGRKRKWKSHVPQQCPVCQKVIHDARNLPRHMGTHTERSCTYLNGLGLCLSVGNVEQEDRVLQTSTTVSPHVQSSMPAQTPTTGPPHFQTSISAQTPTTRPPRVQSSMPAQTSTTGPPRVQTSMRRVASVGVEQDPTAPQTTTVLDSTALQGQQLRPSPAPLLHRSEHNGGAAGGGGGVGEGIGRSSMSVNGGAAHVRALLTPPPHHPPSSPAATLMPPPPADAAAAPPDHLLHLLKHEEEEEEGGEGFRPATGAPPSGEALPASVLAERVGLVGAGGGGGGRKRRFPSQMPQRCPVCQKVIHGAGKLPRHMRTHAERSCTYLNGLGLCLSVGNVEQEDSELGAPSTTSPAHASPPTAAQSQTPAATSPAHLPLTGTDS